MESSLAPAAAAQGGAFSRDQARAAGYTDGQIIRRLRNGAWAKCVPGVYRLAGAPITLATRAWVAVLAAGHDAVLSHQVAAQLHRLDRVPQGSRLDVTVPPARRPRSVPGSVVHRRPLPPGHAVRRDGLPVTSAARTVVDLASQLSATRSLSLVSDALRARLVSAEEIEGVVDRLRGATGIDRARQVFRLVDPRLESGLEGELLALARIAGVRPVPQYEVFVDGRFVARLDLALPELRLGLEADGFGTHAARPGFERDRERHAILQLAGWTLLSFTALQIRANPQWVIDVIAQRVAQLERDRGRSHAPGASERPRFSA